MYIYLPIAEQPIHALVVLGIGWLIGVIMGMVGIGGGFLLTPLMIFFGELSAQFSTAGMQ